MSGTAPLRKVDRDRFPFPYGPVGSHHDHLIYRHRIYRH